MLSESYAQEGNIDKLMALKEKYESQVQSSFPVGKSVLGAFIVKWVLYLKVRYWLLWVPEVCDFPCKENVNTSVNESWILDL